jgi:D-alanyl-D-alanine carboxypeptidase/D-alanyl-D-alanine-endopeptidase (penicillin-binding protein 4)
VLAGIGWTPTTSRLAWAGGSPADHTTPRATVQLMRLMAKRQDYDAFRDCLPRLGVDGTLAEAVPPDSPARDKIQAKTGTLSYMDVFNDRSLLRSSGAHTMTTARGRTLMFAMFVNIAAGGRALTGAGAGQTVRSDSSRP